MRRIQTFVVRLLLDTAEPDALRGAVRCVGDDEDHPFADRQSLLRLLVALTQTQDPSSADDRALDSASPPAGAGEETV